MAIKWDKPFDIRDMRNGQWYWVQKEVLASKDINASDKLVYSALAYYANNKTQECYPSHQQISMLTGLGERTVYRSIKKLTAYHFISTRKNDGKVNYYDLLKVTPAKMAVDEPLPNNTRTPANQQVVPLPNSSTNNTYITRINKNKGGTLDLTYNQKRTLKQQYPYVDIDHVYEKFRAHQRGNGRSYANPLEAFRVWLIEDNKKNKPRDMIQI